MENGAADGPQSSTEGAGLPAVSVNVHPDRNTVNVSFRAGGPDTTVPGGPSPTHVVVRVYTAEGASESSGVVHVTGRRESDVLGAAARWMAENDTKTFIRDISFHQHDDVPVDEHAFELRLYVTFI